MDKYIKQSQKSNLWARRRNNTASRLLQGQIRHMERSYVKDCRQYIRDKLRVQMELRDLGEVPTDLENNADTSTSRNHHDHNTQIRQTSRGDRTNQRKSQQRETILTNEDDIETAGEEVLTTRHKSATDLTSVQKSQDVKNQARVNIHNTQDWSPAPQIISERPQGVSSSVSCISSIPSSGSHDGRTEHGPHPQSMTRQKVRSAVVFTSTPKPTTATTAQDLVSRSLDSMLPGKIPCLYSTDGKPMHHSCQYFPCTVPSTYHTLGFRREDLIPWTSNISVENSKQTRDNNMDVIFSCEHENRSTEKQRLNVNSANGRTTEHDRSQKGNTSFSHRWNKCIPREEHVQFKPVIFGPAFTPKPSDPILELVRTGSSKAPGGEGRVAARVSVRDKMRGLKQMVLEMKKRNEESRPHVDWAVNYGRRMPSRLLLNPVMPIR